MKLPGVFRAVFPQPRQPVTWRSVWPLVLVLVLFLGGCAFVEMRGLLRFAYRPAFWLAVVLPWIWWMQIGGFSGLARGRAVAALLTRLIIACVFIMLLAEPRAVRSSDVLSVVYALDVSDSMGEKVSDQALSWVMQTIAQKPPKDEAGLVVFGRDAAVELPPRATFPFEAMNSRVAKDGTNVAKSLSLAAAMLPEQNQGRIVLITDGNETEGSVTAQLDELKSRGIAVDVLPIGFSYDKEVWLERLDLPRVVKAGETYEASVLLSALQKGAGKLTLTENGKVIFEKQIEFDAGKNRFALPLYLREPGYYEYAATISVPKGEDGWAENNTAIGDLFLRGEGKVLIVSDARSDARDWEPLARALKESERIVQVRMAYEFPRDPLSLMPYDLVIFANAPADSLDVVQMQALRDSVYNNGTGFLMLGGPQSFGPGGFHRSAIEEALPVEMDVKQKKVLPKGALAIILHTCEFAEGNTWAKRMAKEAMRVLGAQDDVGLIAYAFGNGNGQGMNGYNWIFPLTPASEYEKLIPLVNKAEPGDMPDFQTPMQLAFNGLQANDAATKHLIVISDGDPSPPTPALVQQFVDAKITVSMIAINPHGGQDISIMQSISATTGGRYYFPQKPDELPSIFIKEAKTLKRSMLQNRVFTPEAGFPSPVLKGIDALPPLRGFVLTTIKPRAATLLRVPASKDEPGETDPLLATWRFGLGTTAAWTSDLGPSWAQDWLGWDKFRAFVRQLATEISRVEQKTDLRLRTFAAGSTGVISVEDFAGAERFLEMEARVSGPRGENVSVPLRQIGPRRYQGQFPLWGKGRYQVVSAAASAGSDQAEQIVGGFAVPYSPEYLRFRSDPILLKQIAERTGGRVLSAADVDLYHPARSARESTRPVADLFLILLACLIPLDVGIRRIQIDWTVIRDFIFRRKTATSGETMGALLQRKKQVKTTLDAERAERPPPVILPQRPAGKPSSSSPPPTPAKPATPAAPTNPDDPQTTTERLLARKRKRQDDQQ